MGYLCWLIIGITGLSVLIAYKKLKLNLHLYSSFKMDSRKCKDHPCWQWYSRNAFLHKKNQPRIFSLSAKQLANAAPADFCLIFQVGKNNENSAWHLLAGVDLGKFLLPKENIALDQNTLDLLKRILSENKLFLKKNYQEIVFENLLSYAQFYRASSALQLLAFLVPRMTTI